MITTQISQTFINIRSLSTNLPISRSVSVKNNILKRHPLDHYPKLLNNVICISLRNTRTPRCEESKNEKKKRKRTSSPTRSLKTPLPKNKPRNPTPSKRIPGKTRARGIRIVPLENQEKKKTKKKRAGAKKIERA